MLNQILIYLATCLPIVVGFKMYDLFRTRWQYAKVGSREREKYSKLWHATGFWTVLSTVAILTLLQLPLSLIILYGPVACIVVGIAYDIAWNLFNDEGVTYPGNGGGSFTELIFAWMTKQFGFNLSFWTMYTKFILLIMSLVWAFKENL